MARKYSFLFAGELTGGNQTLLKNLQEIIGSMPDVESTWLPIEIEPPEFIAKIPPISMNWSLKGGLVTRKRVLGLEKQGKRFDAAFFNHQVIALWLRDFRKRVPTFITMDSTPLRMDVYGGIYDVKNVAEGINIIQEIKRRITKQVYQGATYLFPWSRWVRDSIIHDYEIPPEKVLVMPPGINLKRWGGPSANKWHQNGAPRNTRVLFIGGDFVRKGGDMLDRIARKEAFADCEFHLVTKSYTGSNGPNIFIYDDYGPNDDRMVELARQADIFALPTRGDLHSVASLEAMAMGLPVISTKVGGIPDIVVDGENGYLLDVDDEAALEDRLLRLKNDRSLREKLGRNARRTVEERFNLETIAGTIVRLMKEAADARTAQRT
jgi:glycosyltransferase involved in cell wall biosynthesis